MGRFGTEINLARKTIRDINAALGALINAESGLMKLSETTYSANDLDSIFDNLYDIRDDIADAYGVPVIEANR